MSSIATTRRMPIGAESGEGGTHFRVWAPNARRVDVVTPADGGRTFRLDPEGDGYFAGAAPNVGAGTRYGFRLDESERLLPDPASRYQPEGPHGLSQVIDSRAFAWTDAGWRGVTLPGHVIYEMHVGTFTREGTWAAAARELAELKRVGISIVEVMPVADFPGTFGWGYDGVNLFAPTRLYGTPDDFRSFVDAAHAHGLGVILDVVYNHFGPDGNYLHEFSSDYVSDVEGEWGRNINFDGERAGPVREYFITNAGYWIDEFHLDGLRLDATQCIVDASPEHVIAAIVRRAREAAGRRSILVVAENETQTAEIARDPAHGGYGVDALWNDDYHHTAIVALTGHNDAYYSDHHGTAQELMSAVKWGYLFQGQRYAWQKKRRGTPATDLPPAAFVTFIENHDQVANSATGERIHQLTSPGRYRALVALTLLAPGTPMLFQGQEFAASSPFLFFADHGGELGVKVREGRGQFLSQFVALRDPEAQRRLADPTDRRTFERCRLDFTERETHAATYRLYRDLLALRREDAAFRAQRPRGVDGAVLNDRAFVLRFFGERPEEDRLLVVNLGADIKAPAIPEPLLAPPPRGRWVRRLTTESADYGGRGAPDLESEHGWHIPGESASVLG